MSNELIRYAFTAGELSPNLYGRGDLEKYDFGLAEAKNWFVDYHGGLSTRFGTKFLDYIDGLLDTKFFTFKFNADIANTYVLLFGHNTLRFLQDGAYVLEDDNVITSITTASPGVVTSAAHGYSTGDWVKIAGRTFEVGVTTANTFQLLDVFGNAFDTTGQTTVLAATAVARIYTLTTNYTSTMVADLCCYQINDTVHITHPDRNPRDLVRLDHASWTLSLTDFSPDIDAPTGISITPDAAGDSGTSYAVTAVSYDGEESLISDIFIESLMADITTDNTNVIVTWTPVSGAEYYNVYRSNVIPEGGTDITKGDQVGYVGRAQGAKFSDNYILPDFTKTPPQYYNPFAQGRIDSINVTAGGAGYTTATAVSVTSGTGSGFLGIAIVDGVSGEVIGVQIINGGSGYADTDTVNFTVGAGATAEIGSVSGTSTTFPAINSVFQQRTVYAASLDQPLTVWGSRPKQYNNFSVSQIITDDDSFEFTLDSSDVTPIRHMVPVRGGLLLMLNNGIWQLSGGGANDPITPTNALAEPHTYNGVSKLFPLQIDVDILYAEAKGDTIRLLSYNDISKVYGGQDVSILSNHLFGRTKRVSRWAYASDPFKLVHAVRDDGAMLSFTVVKEQNVYAWTPWWTKGYFRDVVALNENNTDVVYLAVERIIEGQRVKMIEQLVRREFDHVEDAWCVDSGLELSHTTPAADLTISGISGDVTFTASAAVFAVDDVGKILRAGGGKALIHTFTDTTHLIGNFIRDLTALLPEDNETPQLVESGDWTLDTPVSSVTGLWHLEGQTVQILADGNVHAEKVVTDGSVTLDAPATAVTVGLKFSAVAKTLPPVAPNVVIEARRKRNVAVAARLKDSRGIKIGRELDRLYPMKERTTEAFGEPTLLQQGIRPLPIDPTWTEEGQFYMVVEDPLPATILGYVQDMEVGDDPD